VVEGHNDITTNNWLGVVAKNGSITDKESLKLEGPLNYPEFKISHTATQALEKILLYGGASYKRDAIDARIVNDVKHGTYAAPGSRGSTNGIIDSQNDVGGYPQLSSTAAPVDTSNDGMPDVWKTANKLDSTKAEANGRDLSTAYDNIEVYINSLIKEITEKQY